MKSPSEKKTSNQINEEEQLLSELYSLSQEMLDNSTRLNAQLVDSVKLFKEVTQRVEKQTTRVEDLKERADIEGSKSSCHLF